MKSVAFLDGGGDLGALIRAHDWARTPLGPVEAWPESLRSSLGLCLDSAFPIAIYWGPELALVYNDAWRPILGDKHPWALGRAGREVWPEIWDAIEPVFASVLATGKGVFNGDSLLAMKRFGYVEECYFDYTFNPIRAASGEVGGIFNIVIETTYRVINERRAGVQRDFAASLAGARNPDEVFQAAAANLAAAAADVPFAFVYRVGADGRSAELAHSVGMEAPSAAAPARVDFEAPAAADRWHLAKALSTGLPQRLDDLGARFGPLPGGPWPEPAREAVVLPVATAGQSTPGWLIVAGASPRRAVDAAYLAFFESLAGHIARALASAEAFEAERRRAEALAELDRAKTAFFSNVSHEFRTPLTLMLGPVEDLLQKEKPAEEDRAALEVVRRNGERLLKLVNTLLDFARIEAGRTQASYEPTDLAALTADLASNFRSACERAGLKLVVDCPAAGEQAYVDREMWEKIVLNLLSNAFKFTLQGEIGVHLQEREHRFALTVRDTGSGIPAVELPRMFERFHRVEGTLGRSHEGSGIGLALVQELVKLHGGTIEVDSTPGKGSTFTVSIPKGRAHLPAARTKADGAGASTALRAGAYVEEALSWLPGEERASAAGQTGKRVLLADDNPDLRAYARRLLAEHYDVEAVADGEAALAAARRHRPDLLISDVMMPKLDGFGLIRELRADENLRDLPVILLSARAGEEARIEGLGKGADDYLVKPFNARELLVRAGALLQSAERVREKQNLLAAVVEHMPVGVGLVDLDGRFVLNNAAMSRFVGPVIPSLDDERYGRWRGYHADGRRIEREDYVARRALRGEVVPGTEFLYRNDDGTETWTRIAAVPLRDASGAVSGVICVVQDIDSAKRAEEALRASDQQKVDYLEGLLEGFAAYDDNWVMTYMNAAGERLLGRRREEVLGKTWHKAFPHAVGNPLDLMYQRVMATRRSEHMEYKYDYYGPGCWFEIGASPVATGGVAVYFRDISERKRAEQALRDSEARFRTLTAMSSDWYWEQDEHFRYVDISDEVEVLAGTGRAPYIGTTRWELPHAGVSEEQWAAHRALLERHEPFRGFEYQRILEGGDAIWVSASGAPVFDAEGRFKGYRGTGTNITKRREAEEALREANRRKDEFLATLAHELRNPLAPLRNGLELLRLDAAAAIQGGVSEMMERQVGQLVRLVDDLLEMSRISRGVLELRRQPVEAAAVIKNALETAGPLLRAARHEVEVSLPPESLWLDGDPVRLAQIVGNLLSNAARYTPSAGRVSVRAKRDAAAVQISVRDNGAGFAQEALPRLFEMFSRGGGASASAQGGLGIGLALSRRLAEMHGGTLGGRSEGAGKGAEFTLRLPLAENPAAPSAADSSRGSVSGQRILVVDDNRDAADSLALLLRTFGAEVRVANDGESALAEFEAEPPRVVLLDIGMPGMDGYEVARRLRRRTNGDGVKIVALTGWGQEDDRRKAREAGFDHHLVKPADIGVLRELLASLR